MPLWKLFRWFRRPQLWSTGDWQLHHNNAPIHASHLVKSVLAKHQITQVTQPPYSPDLATCDFWLFQKLKSPLKGKRFQTISEIQENTRRSLKYYCYYFYKWRNWGWSILTDVLGSQRVSNQDTIRGCRRTKAFSLTMLPLNWESERQYTHTKHHHCFRY